MILEGIKRGETVLEARGITKRFPGVVANEQIDFEIKAGEIHAILGENGAGKTTLMNILFGLLQPDEGEIIIRGERVKFRSPLDGAFGNRKYHPGAPAGGKYSQFEESGGGAH